MDNSVYFSQAKSQQKFYSSTAFYVELSLKNACQKYLNGGLILDDCQRTDIIDKHGSDMERLKKNKIEQMQLNFNKIQTKNQ